MITKKNNRKEVFYERSSRYQALYNEANEKLQIIQKLFRTAEKNFNDAKRELSKAERDKNELEKVLLPQQEKKLEEMKKFTLVHLSATLTALDKKRTTVIVCTKFDAEIMRFNKFADCVVDTADDYLPQEDIPYGARGKFNTLQEFYSAIEYVKLVLKYWAEDKSYELLYNSEGIRYILDSLLK